MRYFCPIVIALLALYSARLLAAEKNTPANIVFIVSDDDDYEHFGFMGNMNAELRAKVFDWWSKTGGKQLRINP